jgi:ferredoxin-nitrite reductase
MDDFSEEQKQYLQGLASGLAIAGLDRAAPAAAGTAADMPAGPERLHFEAQNRFTAAGKKLVAEEQAKRAKHPLDRWDELRERARKGEYPKGTDVFLTKFHGLFYVAPAQDSYMLRLRIPCGILGAHQLRGVARLADDCGGGYSHVTTRANLQVREIQAKDAERVLIALAGLGLTSRGSGADNIRNITGDPTAGISAQELIDVRPLCEEMHHYILNHRELYGLPRKFNIAFDGGGPISSVQDTNDIGFAAVRVAEGKAVPAGVYFRLHLGGITGHGDFARDCGVLVRPDECATVAAAVIRVFIAHGDRTNRQKARMKYVIDQHGLEWYLTETEKELGYALPRLAPEGCEPRPPEQRSAHVGFKKQKQANRFYLGVVLPAGKMTSAQMRGLADIAERHGSGTLRLTVWQNLLVSDIAEHDIAAVKSAIEGLGLDWQASSVRAGLVACTGNSGCKFAASDTKRHAQAIADHLERRLALDTPLNIHLTGCHHSCAQHYIGDIGLLACKVGDEEIEGYHVHVGGGYGTRREIARELARDVPATEVPMLLERLLAWYLDQRNGADESFQQFALRQPLETLRTQCALPAALAA